jgi:hypothetical protein
MKQLILLLIVILFIIVWWLWNKTQENFPRYTTQHLGIEPSKIVHAKKNMYALATRNYYDGNIYSCPNNENNECLEGWTHIGGGLRELNIKNNVLHGINYEGGNFICDDPCTGLWKIIFTNTLWLYEEIENEIEKDKENYFYIRLPRNEKIQYYNIKLINVQYPDNWYQTVDPGNKLNLTFNLDGHIMRVKYNKNLKYILTDYIKNNQECKKKYGRNKSCNISPFVFTFEGTPQNIH